VQLSKLSDRSVCPTVDQTVDIAVHIFDGVASRDVLRLSDSWRLSCYPLRRRLVRTGECHWRRNLFGRHDQSQPYHFFKWSGSECKMPYHFSGLVIIISLSI